VPRALRIAAILILLVTGTAFADNITRVLAVRIYPEDKVVFAYRWVTHRKELVCVLSRPSNYKYGSNIEAESIQHFTVYDVSSTVPKAIYKDDISAAVVGVGLTNGQLDIKILGGSANHIRRYSYAGSRIVASLQLDGDAN
jgi:hypothetical protein